VSGYFAAHAPLTCSGGRTMTIMGLPIGVLQLGAWDRQTDRQTDGQIAASLIALYRRAGA